MQKWFDLQRYWFNQTIQYLKIKGTKANDLIIKKLFLTTDRLSFPEWAFDCPQRIRVHAITDACEAIKNAKKKFKLTGIFQEVHYKKKKSPKQVFGFDKKSIKENFLYSEKIHRSKFYATEKIKVESENTRIVRENGRYFLILPGTKKIKTPDNQRLPYVSIDPGVRTFATFFSPEMTGKIGSGDFGRIMRLCLHTDNLISKMSKAKSRQKKRIKKALSRMTWKIKDLISDLHKKTAHFLVTRFDTIYLPTFETSQMVTKLHSKTARMMMTFSHYKFKTFLKIKAEEYSAVVVDSNEAYTSKTCSFCGSINKIGSKKVLKCNSCNTEVDRDINGARGILLRALAVTPSCSQE